LAINSACTIVQLAPNGLSGRTVSAEARLP